MTIVGYNDNIWTDINNNRKVDDGEKGALKIANSWGANWMNDGFIWLSYDALRKISTVTGGPGGPDGTGRFGAIVTGMVFDITMKYDLNQQITPKMVAEFKVNHLKRNQLRISLGISDNTKEVPDITWFPGAIDLDGGPYDFNGETNGCDGTFVFDFTDILLPDSTERKYYLGIYDSILDGNPATLSSFRILDKDNVQLAISNITNNNLLVIGINQGYAYLTYTFNTNINNVPPIAKPVFNTHENPIRV